MAEAELRSLGLERRLIFENVANGVPIDQVRAAFRRSEAEIARELAFVGRKIREARFRTRMPPLACDGVHEIRLNRLALLDTLRQLTDAFLSSELLLPNIGVQRITTPAEFREAAAQTPLRIEG